jgi:hypothetical protein
MCKNRFNNTSYKLATTALCIIAFLFANQTINAQMTVNTFFKAKNIAIIAKNIDIQLNTDSIAIDTATLLVLSGKDSYSVLSALNNTINLNNIKVIGNFQLLDIDTLRVENITFGDKGILDIGETNVTLQGNISGEKEKSYLTSTSDGKLIKKVNINAFQNNILGGIGLEITPTEYIDGDELTIIRTHTPVDYKNNIGAKAVYSFEHQLDLDRVNCYYHKGILNNIESPVIYSYSDNEWIINVDYQQNSNLQRITAKGYPKTQEITIITFPELDYPKIISLSSGKTDFIIIGNEKYNNSRLVILNRNGQVIYDKMQYRNDFDTSILSTDTYYFMYYTIGTAKPIKKSYFEIVN